MSARLQELDWRSTPIGEISLRRRIDPSLHVEVYEVRLGDEYLMSSLFTTAEVQLNAVFARARAHVVPFPNPYTGLNSANIVYVSVSSSVPEG